VLPIVCFLIWRQKHVLRDAPIRADARGSLLTLALASLWVVARLAGVQVVEHATALGMIPAVTVALMGPAVSRKLLFPLLFIFLALPVGDTLIPYLMVVTADISTGLLQISGIPVLREGQYLSLPGGDFVVAEVCSGARYLTTGVMVSLLFGYLTYSRPLKRAVLVGITALVLVIANGVRAYIVMAVASATHMQYLSGRDHVYFGWLLFGIVMMLIMWIAARYADILAGDDTDAGSRSVVATASHTALPVIAALGLIMLAITVKPLQNDLGEIGVMLAAAAALLLFIFMLVRQRSATGLEFAQVSSADARLHLGGLAIGIVSLAVLVMAPRVVAGIEEAAAGRVIESDAVPNIACDPVGPWASRWQPDFAQPDVEHALAFDCAGHTVNVYVAAYVSALQGRELISSTHHPVPPRWSRYSSSRIRTATVKGGPDSDVTEVVVSGGGYDSIVWYWYDVDGYTTTTPLQAKVRQILALAQKRPAGGRVTVIETSVSGDEAGARARLEHVAADLLGEAAATAGPESTP